MKTKIIFTLTVLMGLTGYSQMWDTVYFSYEYQYEDSLFEMEFVALPNNPISPFDYSIWGPDIDITAGNGASSQYEGIPNTNSIVEQLGDNGGVTYAAGYCHNLTVFGHNDWYLPAQMELFAACSSNPDADGLLWSSTEISATTAMGVYSNNGAGTEIAEKDHTFSNCCVRRESGSYVGINTISGKERLRIATGRANGTVSILLEEIIGNVTITIYNIQGYCVFEKSINTGRKEYRETIDVSGYTKGTYIVEVRNRKFVKIGKFVL